MILPALQSHSLLQLIILVSAILTLSLLPYSFAEPVCNISLWDHVYNPDRLEVIKDCVTVTGTIEHVTAEADGDYHVRLALDPEFVNMTNSANTQYQHGDLVVEPVCEHSVTQADAVAACSGFSGNITIPAVGTHVMVTGPYVLDKDHYNWAEIHPATAIREVTTPEFGSLSAIALVGGISLVLFLKHRIPNIQGKLD